MPLPIEDYALLGDRRSAALVGRDGSIDWLCVPRFDAGACFAALLGEPKHGRWLLRPVAEPVRTKRRYTEGTLVLETELETDEGVVRLIDFMPVSEARTDLVRIVEGVRGKVPMKMELIIRFDYGSTIPWVHKTEAGLAATAGPDSLDLVTPVPLRGQDLTTLAEFTVSAGERIPFLLTYSPSHEPSPPALDAEEALAGTTRWWREWSARCTSKGPWHGAVVRSLITLKALTYAPTGGMVAAPTTSLPEQPGGVRNWDYRFCWLRDATFTLYALLLAGYREEARAWREWLVRAVAGAPQDLQILYGVAGERRLDEATLPWLPGYHGASPVRIGNAASSQFQLDVYGEVMDSLHLANTLGLGGDERAWEIQRVLLDFLESHWDKPDEGIWEVRGPRRPFTHSKVMAWVAVDRAVKSVERFGRRGAVDRWRQLRDTIHAEVCAKGFDAERNAFVQFYGSKALDASLLMIPMVGFLPPTDPRVRGTVEAIERELVIDRLVRRYLPSPEVDGLPPGEGVFLPCSFWLADNLDLLGRHGEAVALFEYLSSLANDVGLFSEEYDPVTRRMLGNFPQALTHVAFVNTARNLSDADGPSRHRPKEG